MNTSLWIALKQSAPRNTLVFIACCMLPISSAFSASSSSCSVSSTGLAFGIYDTESGNNDDVTGTITVTCGSSGVNVSVALSAGSGSYTTRTLKNGTSAMNYNIYTDTNRSTVWGDGTGSTSTRSGTTSSGNPKKVDLTMYGRVPPNQYSVVPGSFTDTVNITVTY